MNSSNNTTENSVKIVMKLLKLIEEINTTNSSNTSGSTLQKDIFYNKLLEEGYSEKEINDAIKYLVFLLLLTINQDQNIFSNKSNQIKNNPDNNLVDSPETKVQIIGMRQLHVMEAIRLTPDAQAYIKNLLNYGLINTIHFERVIEYLWKYDLREVNQARLELILQITNPEAYYKEIPRISNKIGNISMFVN